jgi:DNA-binding LacI/PurR family transcriptional regulator
MPPKNKSTVTLNDIGRVAGVSRATVSRALKDNPVISSAVRERIQKIAKELGYRPDPETARLMSHLKSSNRSRYESTIGILNAFSPLSNLYKNSYAKKLLEGAQSRADALGYSIDMLNLGEAGMSARRIDQIILARGIRGILIPPEPDPLFRTTLDLSKIAAVATTTTAETVKMHRVLPNNFFNVRLMLEEAIAMGYQRIGFIQWKELEQRQNKAGIALYALFALLEKRIAPLPIFEWNWRAPDLQSGLRNWIEKNRPDCILGFGEECLQIITEASGRRIPQDFAFISYGEAPEGITRIDENASIVGSAAIDILSAHIQRGDVGPPEFPKTTLIEGRFVHDTTTVLIKM